MKPHILLRKYIPAFFIMILSCHATPIIIDHNDVDITQLTTQEIERAKTVLHIGYGHTSHGSQITDGMNGLVSFANNGGLGLNLPDDIFAWNNGGSDGALDLEEGSGYSSGWLQLDGGYWPTWYNETIEYLEDASHDDVNVIMWSWCGQMDDKYSGGTLSNQYLIPMSNLETTYPDVVFVYMTGHVEISDDADNKSACEAIRNYCIENNKVFFDFNDIEHHNPDGTFFEFVSDACNYYDYAGGSQLGNWATEWQASHTENVDWYNCGSAHSEPLNANMKAYAIWKLWCEIAKDLDRDGLPDEWEEQYGGSSRFNDPTADSDGDGVPDGDEYIADTNPTNASSAFRLVLSPDQQDIGITFACSNSRVYHLEKTSSLITGTWTRVSGQTNMTGDADGSMSCLITEPTEQHYYRVSVGLPEYLLTNQHPPPAPDEAWRNAWSIPPPTSAFPLSSVSFQSG